MYLDVILPGKQFTGGREDVLDYWKGSSGSSENTGVCSWNRKEDPLVTGLPHNDCGRGALWETFTRGQCS